MCCYVHPEGGGGRSNCRKNMCWLTSQKRVCWYAKRLQVAITAAHCWNEIRQISLPQPSFLELRLCQVASFCKDENSTQMLPGFWWVLSELFVFHSVVDLRRIVSCIFSHLNLGNTGQLQLKFFDRCLLINFWKFDFSCTDQIKQPGLAASTQAFLAKIILLPCCHGHDSVLYNDENSSLLLDEGVLEDCATPLPEGIK